MTLLHPGKYYLERLGSIQSAEDILGFAEFLRRESGLDGMLPVDLNAIYTHFDIPKPKYVPLSGQQGLLVDAERGIIAINSRDPETRQRFSEAHELAEMLFSTLSAGIDLGGGWFLKRPGGYRGSTKELYCNRVAADLLMPPEFVDNWIKKYGVNFDCARVLSDECEISLSAALVQIARLSYGCHSVVVWKMKNKPSEIKKMVTDEQLNLFGGKNPKPIKKLRVEWSIGGPRAHFIPKDKSVDASSLVFSAWQSSLLTSGKERLCLDGRKSAWYQTQNLPFTYEGETWVLSLVEYLSQGD